MELTLSHLLAVARLRPQLYLGAPRMSLLEPFVDGFLVGTSRDIDRHAYGSFREWLWESKGLEREPFCTASMIKLTGSDEHAFLS